MDNGTVPPEIDPADSAAPDGGPLYLNWNLAAAEGLHAGERGVLQSLGAAVVARWGHLPRDIQKMLFKAAAGGAGGRDIEGLRGDIARFLHDSDDLKARDQAKSSGGMH